MWDRRWEIIGATLGLIGAYLVANKGPHAAWGFVVWMGSCFAWFVFAVKGKHWFLFAQTVGFTYTNIIGIARWF